MKVLIVEFSQSGNTREIARAISEGIIDSGNSADIVPIKNAGSNCADGYDLIGIGTPTFFYREPRNVSDFIRKMAFLAGGRCFIFCTHGSIIGNTFHNMRNLLNERGYTVIGAFDCYASTSLQFYPAVMHTEGHPDPSDKDNARRFGKEICDLSRRIQKGEKEHVPTFTVVKDVWWSKTAQMLSQDFLRKISPKLEVDLNKCTRCLQCEQNCPVDAIDIMNDPPLIQLEACIFCWYCEKSCPEKAIIADWTDMQAGSRANLKKYIVELEAAERSGTFRPHVDYKKITGA